MRFLVSGTIPIGSMLGGVLATGVGVVHNTIWIRAFLPFLLVLLSPVRSLRTMPVSVGAGVSTEGTVGGWRNAPAGWPR